MNQIIHNNLNRIRARISIEGRSFFREMLYLILLIQGLVWLFVLLQIFGIDRPTIQGIGLSLTVVSFILYETYQGRRMKRKRIRPKAAVSVPVVGVTTIEGEELPVDEFGLPVA